MRVFEHVTKTAKLLSDTLQSKFRILADRIAKVCGELTGLSRQMKKQNSRLETVNMLPHRETRYGSGREIEQRPDSTVFW